MRAEDIAVRHVERGAIPVVRLQSGQFAVRPAGDAKAILTSILDEVDRYVVRPGKVRRPHEMSRTSWPSGGRGWSAGVVHQRSGRVREQDGRVS